MSVPTEVGMRQMGSVIALGMLVGCFGGPEAPEAPETLHAPVSPGPANRPDAGPGGLSADVVAAYKAVAPDGRLIRCELPADIAGDFGADGPLSGLTTQNPHDPLELPWVSGGWFSAVAPVDSHTATLVRGDKAVGMVSWRRAVAGQWNECSVLKAYPYSVVGRVTDTEDQPLAGASVIGCSADKPVLSDKDGRFDLPGVFGRACVVVAFIRDRAGLGYSPPSIVDSGGVDTLLEVVVPASRIDAGQEQLKLQGALAVAEDRLRAGIAADVERLRARVDAANLPAGPRAVADGWLNDLTRREEAARARLTAAQAGGKDALLTLPSEAF